MKCGAWSLVLLSGVVVSLAGADARRASPDEKALGKAANIELKPGEAGDMRETAADIAATTRDLGWSPKVTVEEGIPRFVDWFKSYNRL